MKVYRWRDSRDETREPWRIFISLAQVNEKDEVIGEWSPAEEYDQGCHTSFCYAILRVLEKKDMRFLGTIPDFDDGDHPCLDFRIIAEPVAKESGDTDSPSPYDLSDGRHPASRLWRK